MTCRWTAIAEIPSPKTADTDQIEILAFIKNLQIYNIPLPSKSLFFHKTHLASSQQVKQTGEKSSTITHITATTAAYTKKTQNSKNTQNYKSPLSPNYKYSPSAHLARIS